jgi:hypothetical protein
MCVADTGANFLGNLRLDTTGRILRSPDSH